MSERALKTILQGLARVVPLVAVWMAPQIAAAQPLAAPNWLQYHNGYIAFAAPPGWARSKAKSDFNEWDTLRMTSPDGRSFIDVHPATSSGSAPIKAATQFMSPYLERLHKAGRAFQTRTMEIKHPSISIFGLEAKITPKKGGDLLVDKYPAFACFSVYRAGFLQQICAFAVDFDALENGPTGKALAALLKSVSSTDEVQAAEWKPGS